MGNVRNTGPKLAHGKCTVGSQHGEKEYRRDAE